MSAEHAARRRGDMRGVFIFALLAAFALLSLSVVLVGAQSYRMINATAERAYLSRTGLSYLAGKVRGADEAGMLEIRNEDGMEILALSSLHAGERYVTYIYCDGAQVREYFARADLGFSSSYGEKICPAGEMRLTLERDLLTIALVDEGGAAYSVSLCLQAAKEGGA
ncbi:hypothetical protein SDC9_191010 [bioreactor metagenome]|uniref:DUF4860 domain-containing protein n=1 Tax=bioreactor metagenome TaxID=1076179 RepID=A0A645HX57_9ZZZZ|nr:DUF4860 domain-containing protein [Christensenella sp.]